MQHGRVLINGAGGFLGSHTVEAFVEAGYDCRITDLPSMSLEWAKPLGVEIVPADLRDFEAVSRVCQGVDGIVNVAGVFDFSQPWDVLYAGNVTVTEHMCRAALEAGVDKFVHIASVAVYGEPAVTPMVEDGPKRPKNAYETTKLLGEQVVTRYQREAGLPATSLRPAPIYGPRSRYIHSLMFATASLMAIAPKDSFAFGDGVLSHHVHVHDVARAAVRLMALPRTIGKAYNCADLTPIRWHRVFGTIGALVGLEPARVLPWSNALMGALVPLMVRLWPQSRLERDNARLGRAWDRVVENHGLVDALRPRLARDMFQYMGRDHVYDTMALRDLGFTWRYPHVVDGLAATYEWLVDHRWIPDLRAGK